MHFSSLVVASALVAAAAASPIDSSPHTVHEKRDVIPAGWEKRDALDRRAILPMRIGLAQSNMDKGHLWLEEVSSPDSKKYGKHWTAKEVAEAFAPSKETVDAVTAWLASSGINPSRIKQSQGLNWLDFEATVDEAEQLLDTKYHVYEHESGQPHVACEAYSVPAHLREHIDLITPTVHFDAKILPRGSDEAELQKRDAIPGIYKGLGHPGSGSLPKGGWKMPYHHNISNILATCDDYITPDCLRALYEFPTNFWANPENSYGRLRWPCSGALLSSPRFSV